MVLRINVSKGGIPKRPVPEALVTALGIEGDEHANPDIHGGPRKALLLLSFEAIAELAAMGFPLAPGVLGENVTTQGLDHRAWRAGQRWRLGDEVVIEFTKLRRPCKTLTPLGNGIQAALFDELAKADDPASPRWALGGFYARVIAPGMIRTGDAITQL